MMYPAMVILVMIVVGVLMMIYVVPGLAASFREAGAALPPLTALVISISDSHDRMYWQKKDKRIKEMNNADKL